MPLPAPPAVHKPAGAGPFPGVVLGAEAFGINQFILDVQERLVGLGYAAAVPDYYHGDGPTRPESYDDFAEVTEHISRLDFTCGARDLAEAVDAVRATEGVDPGRVAVWGYCTGGTLAWLAASMRGDVAAAVLFFPSQPKFHELGPATPVQGPRVEESSPGLQPRQDCSQRRPDPFPTEGRPINRTMEEEAIREREQH